MENHQETSPVPRHKVYLVGELAIESEGNQHLRVLHSVEHGVLEELGWLGGSPPDHSLAGRFSRGMWEDVESGSAVGLTEGHSGSPPIYFNAIIFS